MAEITYYSLRDYNNGELIPFTIDCSGQTYDDHLEEIRENLERITEEKDDGEIREEWIVADYEDIPEHYVGTWSIDSEFFDYLEAMENSHLDEEAFAAGAALDIPLDEIEEAYRGQYESAADFAEQYAEEVGLVDSTASWPQYYIDWERAANDLMMDFNCENGHYFSANY